MNESAPVPYESRWLVWTDHRTTQFTGAKAHEATWFWAASGPRGHLSGAETTAEDAKQRAYAAFMSLMGYHELHPPGARGTS